MNTAFIPKLKHILRPRLVLFNTVGDCFVLFIEVSYTDVCQLHYEHNKGQMRGSFSVECESFGL